MRLTLLAALSLAIVGSTALVLTKKEAPAVLSETDTTVYSVKNDYAPLPLFEQKTALPELTAESAIAVDVSSGVVLYEKNPDNLILPASTTKIITALVALDYYETESVLTVKDTNVDGRKMNLVAGETLYFKDLLYGLLVFSANDAAETLADNYPGGRENFIAAMNLKAAKLGLAKSTFTNPSGLETVGHNTTARDLIRAAQVAMKNETFAEAVSTERKIVKSTDNKYSHYLNTTNELLGELDGVIGVKTGWTENARENLVTFVRRDDRDVITAVMGSSDRFGETSALVDWVFENYRWEEITYSP